MDNIVHTPYSVQRSYGIVQALISRVNYEMGCTGHAEGHRESHLNILRTAVLNISIW